MCFCGDLLTCRLFLVPTVAGGLMRRLLRLHEISAEQTDTNTKSMRTDPDLVAVYCICIVCSPRQAGQAFRYNISHLSPRRGRGSYVSLSWKCGTKRRRREFQKGERERKTEKETEKEEQEKNMATRFLKPASYCWSAAEEKVGRGRKGDLAENSIT